MEMMGGRDRRENLRETNKSVTGVRNTETVRNGGRACYLSASIFKLTERSPQRIFHPVNITLGRNPCAVKLHVIFVGRDTVRDFYVW